MNSEDLIMGSLCQELVSHGYAASLETKGGHGPWIDIAEKNPAGKSLRNKFAAVWDKNSNDQYTLRISRRTFRETKHTSENFWELLGEWDINDPEGIPLLLDVLKGYEDN